VTAADVALVTAADEAFAAPASLALISAARSTTLPVRPVLLADGVAGSTSARLRAAFARAGVVGDIVQVQGDALDALPRHGRISRATYARLFVSTIVADAKRVLWLDADTLTVEPIDELVSAELEGQAVGAVRDVGVPFVSSPLGVPWRRLGIPPGVGSFNAGVMLIDVEQWSAQRVGERAVELLRESPELSLMDQAALNEVLAGRWLPLDERWNARAHVKPALGRGGWLLSRGGLRPLRPAAILHWVGHLKPWDPRHPPSPDRRTYLQAWRRWLPDFPLDVSTLHLSWYARRARRVIRSADGSS
jgi:lipopolysaccharide biosynthesis glycosyltransferase